MTQARPTLRTLVGAPSEPMPLSRTALIMIDCQQTYREGVMQLEGVEAALQQCAELLVRARQLHSPVIHIVHDGGAGTPYDINAPIGQIADLVAPQPGETIIAKKFPSSFEQTDLDAELKRIGVANLTLVGFMTHMCVNSTARAGFNRGYRNTVVAGATATRALNSPGGVLSASTLHNASLAGIADMFAVVINDESDLPA